MSATYIYLCVLIVSSMVCGLVFVLFGQFTVKKLRKNPATKDVLGLDLASGWDIINIAQSLTLPYKLYRIIEKSSLKHFFADKQVIESNTSRLDKILGQIFYILFVSISFFGVVFVVLEFLGILE